VGGTERVTGCIGRVVTGAVILSDIKA
jgi:hypothetical protein